MMRLDKSSFERAVERAVRRIPEAFRERLENVAVSVADRPSAELLAEMGIPPGETLFGVYTGIPLPERSVFEPPLFPDEIIIFQEPLMAVCRSLEELETEIGITVVHEVAHYLGIDEDRLADLGYA